ncbi:SAC3 family protein C isoform X2 [Gastrolobium bilobum]|uniref:SAC3 family protein C isoform X2 n=1 Tax=Gastrolobium bilobum TaxID=150636 RepID=UPI002AB0CF8F|nr:SAC3 family protein C isoform X2 [Gastrolobium bilobum]
MMEGRSENPRSSYSHSRRPRGQKLHSNATHQSKVSTFAQRGTSSSTTTSSASTSYFNNKQDAAQGSSNFGPLVGTCPYMCPERERIQREKLRDLAVFERLNGNPGKSSPALAVKKFCRTISAKYVQASDIRPLTVLEDTLNYLLSLLESKEHPFEVVHDFIFDRTRSIRQDITMQNIVSKKAIYMYEGMAEPLSLWFSHLSAPVLKSKEMCFARRILRSFRLGNYKDFFNTAAAQASYLQYCIMEPYINEVRALALSCINFGGYKLHPYPLFDLSKYLMLKESDLESLCNSCGLETYTDESGNKFLPTKQTTFSHPKGGFQNYSFLGLQQYER